MNKQVLFPCYPRDSLSANWAQQHCATATCFHNSAKWSLLPSVSHVPHIVWTNGSESSEMCPLAETAQTALRLCECGVQAFCPAGVWGRQWRGLFPRPLQHGPCSSNLISTAACCSLRRDERSYSRRSVWRVAPSAGESRQYKLPTLSLWRFLY